MQDRLDANLRGNCRKNLASRTGEHVDRRRVAIFEEQAHSRANFGFCDIKTRGGTPCQRPAIRGRKRCRLHGGLSPGAPRGEKNGNFKTGDWTLDAIEERPEGESRACANQLAGNSLRQSVIYFPQNTPSTSISFGVSSGRNSGSKLRPIGAVST
jgi:hypothetical protein